MMVLLLMSMTIATISCNKEEPEEIIEAEKDVSDIEFDFFNDAKYLYTKPYKLLEWFDMNVYSINGNDYSSEFRDYLCPLKGENRYRAYSAMVKSFHSEEELLKSDFSNGYSYIIQSITPIDFSKQTYVVVCWTCSYIEGIQYRAMDMYHKDDKYVIKYYEIGKGIATAVEHKFMIYLIDEPKIEAKNIRVFGVSESKD